MSEPLPLVVGLGVVDPALVAEVFAGRCRFVAQPTETDLREAQGAIARADADIDTAFLDRAPRLRVVARTGVGVERVDLDAATARGIAVVVTPGSGAVAVAEGAIAMAMHLVKRFGRLTDLVRSGRWADRGAVAVGDLAGSTLGVVGFGRIGQHAGTLGAALGMKVLAYDPVAEPPAAYRCRHARPSCSSRSDVITLHLPLTPDTHHLIDAETLALTKPGAILVNCGRGSLIDNDAAYHALVAGRIAGLGLDVFDPEPPQHHPLFDHPDVVLTPHLMGLSRQATAATFTAAATGVVDVLEGREPAAVANPHWRRDAASTGGSTVKDLLTGKVVLVSGGTQGLGAGIARAAAREGATLVIAGRNAEHGEQVVAELTAAGAQACYVQADITDVAQAVAAVETTVEPARADRLTGQLRRADHPRHPAGHHRGAVRPAHRGQPQGPVLPDAGGRRRHEEAWRPRNDRQHHLHRLPRRAVVPRAVRRGQGRPGRADPQRRPRAPLGPDPDQRAEHRLVGHRRRER